MKSSPNQITNTDRLRPHPGGFTYPGIKVEGGLLQILQSPLHELKRVAVYTGATLTLENSSEEKNVG